MIPWRLDINTRRKLSERDSVQGLRFATKGRYAMREVVGADTPVVFKHGAVAVCTVTLMRRVAFRSPKRPGTTGHARLCRFNTVWRNGQRASLQSLKSRFKSWDRKRKDVAGATGQWRKARRATEPRGTATPKVVEPRSRVARRGSSPLVDSFYTVDGRLNNVARQGYCLPFIKGRHGRGPDRHFGGVRWTRR